MYVRFFTGHEGKFGNEFLEFEISNNKLRYVNNSNYRNDTLIRKQVYLSDSTINQLKEIIINSEILQQDDQSWPEPDRSGKQELEIILDQDHISFSTAKVGSLVEVNKSKDPEGLKTFYYLSQDLKCFIFSLITLHFKIKPI